MIEAKTRIGTFMINNRAISSENKSIIAVFNEFVKNEHFSVSDGPEDYAMAKMLADTLNKGFEVIRQDLDDNEVIY